MADPFQNQDISSAWIGNRVYVDESNSGTLRYFGDIIGANGKWCGIELDNSFGENDGKIDNERYFMCKEKHGIFVPVSEAKPCKIGQNSSPCFSNHLMYFSSQKRSNKIEDPHFSFGLSIEKNSNGENIDSHSDSLLQLNKTFNVGVESTGQIEFCENQIPKAINETINHPTIKSVCLPEKSSIQLNLENCKVLDETFNISTLEPEYVLEDKGFTNLYSEESLGIIPEVLENSLDLLGSCSGIFNKKNKDCSTEISEIFPFPSPNCHDLKKQCFDYIDRHLHSNASDSNYTSTPKVFKNYKDSDFSEVFLQDIEVKVDEPIIAGSSHTVSEIFDAEEFHKNEVFTSTSKLSSLLQIHSSDLLNKTSNLDNEHFIFECKEVSGICNYNLTESSKETLEVNGKCKEEKAFASLHQTDAINSTFEVKSESSQEIFPNENCLDTSILPRKCISLNKTVTVSNLNNVSGGWNNEESFKNSNLHELNQTQTLKSCNELNCHYMNATYTEVIENLPSFNMQLSECSIPSEINSLNKTSTKSKKYSSRENFSLAINNSDSSFKIASKELQTKQSASERFNRRCSLSAYPTWQKTNSAVSNITQSLPVPSKAQLHSSKQRSRFKTKGVVCKSPKKFVKMANTACLPKPVKSDAFEKCNKSVNACPNSLGLQGTAVQSKELKYSEASLKIRGRLQAKAVVKPSLNGTFITNVPKHLSFQKGSIRSNYRFLKSHREGNNYSKDKNEETCSALDKITDKGNATVSQKIGEISEKMSTNDLPVQIKELPSDKYMSKIVNKASLESEIVIKAKADIKSTPDCPFIKNDLPDNFSSEKKNVKSDSASLKPPTKKNHLKDKQTCTAAGVCDKENTSFSVQEKSETASKILNKSISVQYRTVQIEESSTICSPTELLSLTRTEKDNSVANILNENFIYLSTDTHDKNSKSISERSIKESKNINSNVPLKCRVKGIFSNPSKPRLSFVPTFKSRSSNNLSKTKDACKNKHTAYELQGPFEKCNKSKNILTQQIKELSTDNSVTNTINLADTKSYYSIPMVLNETFIDMPNDSCDKSSKNISEESTKKCKISSDFVKVCKSSTRNSPAELVNRTKAKDDNSVTDILDKNFSGLSIDSHDENSKDISAKSTKECKNINLNDPLRCVKSTFSNPVKPKLSLMPRFKSRFSRNLTKTKDNDGEKIMIKEQCKNKHNTNELKGASDICSKSRNDHTIQIKESSTDTVNLADTKSDHFVPTVPSATLIDMPNDSCDKSSKNISEELTEERKINSDVSLKYHVKGIFSKPANKQKLSFMPTFKSRVVSNLSDSKGGYKDKHIENEQDPSTHSSKPCPRNIQIPRFHLKSSSGKAKETMRLEEKPLQKENIESNSLSLGMKDSKLKSYQSGKMSSVPSGKFCHTGKVLRPIAGKASNVVRAPIPTKESSNSVKLKSDQRISSSLTRHQSLPLRKIQAPSSQRIR